MPCMVFFSILFAKMKGSADTTSTPLRLDIISFLIMQDLLAMPILIPTPILSLILLPSTKQLESYPIIWIATLELCANLLFIILTLLCFFAQTRTPPYKWSWILHSFMVASPFLTITPIVSCDLFPLISTLFIMSSAPWFTITAGRILLQLFIIKLRLRRQSSIITVPLLIRKRQFISGVIGNWLISSFSGLNFGFSSSFSFAMSLMKS